MQCLYSLYYRHDCGYSGGIYCQNALHRKENVTDNLPKGLIINIFKENCCLKKNNTLEIVDWPGGLPTRSRRSGKPCTGSLLERIPPRLSGALRYPSAAFWSGLCAGTGLRHGAKREHHRAGCFCSGGHHSLWRQRNSNSNLTSHFHTRKSWNFLVSLSNPGKNQGQCVCVVHCPWASEKLTQTTEKTAYLKISQTGRMKK